MKLDTSIKVRLSKQEKNELINQADKFQLKLSTYIRLKFLIASIPKITTEVNIDWEKYRKLNEISRKLTKIGTNVNQMAHAVNLSIQLGQSLSSELNQLTSTSNQIQEGIDMITEIRIKLDKLTGLDKKSD